MLKIRAAVLLAAICAAFLPPYMAVVANVDIPRAKVFSEAPAAIQDVEQAVVMASQRLQPKFIAAPAAERLPAFTTKHQQEDATHEDLREIQSTMRSAFADLASQGEF